MNSNDKQKKFENPIRMQELKPEDTLEKVGLAANHVLCDIGAGTGIFTIPAAKITKKKVYAIDIQDEMLAIIGDKAKAEGIGNIERIKVSDERYPMTDGSVDIALMVTVFHEIKNKSGLLQEITRILKDTGKMVIIEFHKRQTPMGPPVERRLAKDEVIEKLTHAGLMVREEFDLGDNFYCLVFEKESHVQ